MSITLGGGEIATVFLVLMRCIGVVIAAPLFGHRSIPAPVKAGLAGALAISIAPHVTIASAASPLVMAAPIELVIGLMLGFLVNLGFAAIELIGRLLALQMGLSLSSVLSPTSEEGGTSLDPLFSIMAGLTFLALNLHLAVVQALSHSFTTFPLGSGWPAQLPQNGAQVVGTALDMGVSVGMPLALALLMCELAIALLARAIPQINVFILGLPFKLLVGTVVAAAALPSLVRGATAIFTTLFRAAGSGVVVP